MRYLTQGMTMHTPAGWVDLVPLHRRMKGDKSTAIHPSEKDAAVLALVELGVEAYRIGNFVNVSHTVVLEVLRAHGVKVAPQQQAFKGISEKALRREQRRAQRVMVDGRLIHQDAPHGTDFAYTDYGCHCKPCQLAHAAALAETRRRKAVAA